MKDVSTQYIKQNNKEIKHNDLVMRRFLSRFSKQEIIKYRTEKLNKMNTKPDEQPEYHGYNTPEYVTTLVKNLYV